MCVGGNAKSSNHSWLSKHEAVTFQSGGICIDLLILELKETSIKLKAGKKLLLSYWMVSLTTFE